jgi:membrane-anchored protein YejM (alkaline phosphatase superfamily)
LAGIFVDRLVDDDQQAGAMQRQNMVMQIAIPAVVAIFAAVAFEHTRNVVRPAHWSMIPKSAYWFSEKIMLKQ